MPCSYCKCRGHRLYNNIATNCIEICCSKSKFYERKFKSQDVFQGFLRVQESEHEIQDICEELWDLDRGAKPGRDYKIAPKGQRLFKFVKQNVLHRSTFANFIKLLDNYEPVRGYQEAQTFNKQQEIQKFLNSCMDMPVMAKVLEYLNKYNYFPGGRKKFIKELKRIWFDVNEEGTSAFEHIFVGEIVCNQNSQQCAVHGFHNWITYYLRERDGDITYTTTVGNNFPDYDAVMINIKFKWLDEHKPISSMLIGSSPEFELALYTLVLFTSEQEDSHTPITIEDTPIDIHCIWSPDTHGRRVITTIYPLQHK